MFEELYTGRLSFGRTHPPPKALFQFYFRIY